MTAKVAIVSLRFNPAFVQHSVAYAKAVSELGYDVGFVLNRAYRRFSDFERVAPIFDPADASPAPRWTHAAFMNPSTENSAMATKLKKGGTKILYVYHEPWQMSPQYLTAEGLPGTLRAILAHRSSISNLKIADTVILASQYGLSEYRKSDDRFNKNSVYIPLLFDDEATEDLAAMVRQKCCFGYIGNLCRSHGFDQFVSFMKRALQRDKDVRFLVASRVSFPARLLRDPILSKNLDRIEIRCGQPLGNDEINQCYVQSLCVWNIYRRSTQSGVLPKAFMFGTPVIASKVGSFSEWVRTDVNGRFAEADDFEGILAAFEEIRNNISSYASGSRQTFLETFFYRSNLAAIRRILE